MEEIWKTCKKQVATLLIVININTNINKLYISNKVAVSTVLPHLSSHFGQAFLVNKAR